MIGTRKSTLHIGSAAMALACVGGGLSAAHAAPPAPMRQRVLIDADWRFQMDTSATLANAAEIRTWRWRSDARGLQDAASLTASDADTAGPEWRDAAPGDDVFQGRSGYAWFRATLPDIPSPHRLLRLKADDNADVYLNGVKLAHHEGWNSEFDVPLDAAWKAGGPNVVAILIQNLAGGGGLGKSVSVGSSVVTADPTQPDFKDAS